MEEAGAANEAALATRRKNTEPGEETAPAEDGETVVDDDDEETASLESLSLFPHPFDGARRPNRASRALVASLLPSTLPLAIKETREWTAAKRNAGARLLGVVLVYAREETHASSLMPSILNALIDAVTDDDKDTAERVLVAARAIGRYAPNPDQSWIPLVADVVAGEPSSTTPVKRAASLLIAAAATRATPPKRLTASACRSLADALASPNVLNGFDDRESAVRTQCLSAAANLVAVAGRSGALSLRDGDGDEKEKNGAATERSRASAALFRVLLQTRAAESSLGDVLSNDTGDVGATSPYASPGGANPLPPSERSASASAAAMAKLAEARGFARVDDLYLAHASDALASARVEAERVWDAPNPSQRAFCAFFLDAPTSVFKEGTSIADESLAVFTSAGEQSRDPRLRAAMLRAMDAAFEEPPPGPDGVFSSENRGGALIGGLDRRAVAILETVVLESLVWRAGATAAAARYAAVVCLGTMLRRSLFFSHSSSPRRSESNASTLLVSRRALLAVLLKHHSSLLPGVFSAMEEDYYAETRKAACYALDGVLATAGVDLGDELRRATYPEILKRMDDSRDDVRVAAARCARRFFSEACPVDWDETNCLYFLKPLFVHMDDPNEDVRNAVLDAALAAAEKKPAALLEALTPARETHRFREHVERALEAASAKLSGERR